MTHPHPPNAQQASQARAKIEQMKRQFEQKRAIADSLAGIGCQIGVYSGKGRRRKDDRGRQPGGHPGTGRRRCRHPRRRHRLSQHRPGDEDCGAARGRRGEQARAAGAVRRARHVHGLLPEERGGGDDLARADDPQRPSTSCSRAPTGAPSTTCWSTCRPARPTRP